MAENTLVKEQLTNSMIEAGAELTAKLDESGLLVTAAFWLFMPDVNEWRLLFASPEVRSKGPRRVYRQIQEAVSKLGPDGAAVPLSVIGVLDDAAELPRLLKYAIQTGAGVGRIRFSKNVINGHFIDDALIYRSV